MSVVFFSFCSSPTKPTKVSCTSESINNVFKIPISLLSESYSLPDSLVEDLEILASKEQPLYEKLLQPSIDSTSKSIIPQLATWYTTNTLFLKETQQLLKNYEMTFAETTNDIWTLWLDYKNEKDFIGKYQYMDWDSLKWVNDSETFLLLGCLYNIASPLISLVLPILMLLVPFFLLFLEGRNITFQQYLDILFHISEGNAISRLFSNFHQSTTDEKLYLMFSAAVYAFSFYQNFILCCKFCNNLVKINSDLIRIRDYITTTIDVMQTFLVATGLYTTYSPFQVVIRENQSVLKDINKELCTFTPFAFEEKKLFELGYIMKSFYSLFEKQRNVDALLYSFGFNGYLDAMLGLRKHIVAGTLNEAIFLNAKKNKNKNKKSKMKDMFYLGLIGDQKESIVKNQISLDKNVVVTGPNASGKTTILKATLLNIIMSQQFGFGCYEKFLFTPYRHFHCYLNITDTCGRDSLFQTESKKCNSIIDSLKEYPKDRHFCVFDELFSGTNPKEAVNCGYGYLGYLCKKKNHVDFILTTHYMELCKKLETNNDDVDVFRMAVQNSEPYVYTYKIEKGYNTIDGGIEVLKQMKFPDEIIQTIQNA
jgi:hypothetical protein